jgi:carboxymethylenebutenolidase
MSTRLEHYHQYLIEEFAEEYQAHRIGRRELLRRVLLLTGSVPLTATTLFALGCGDSSGDDDAPPVPTEVPVVTTEAGIGPGVAATDPAVQAQSVRFPGQAGDVLGYLARPVASGSFPAVLVIPENQGLVDHFRDLARRYAKEGFVALAFDQLSRAGGTPATPDMQAISAAYRSITAPQMLEDMKTAVAYLKSHNFVRANALGVSGFCMGGDQAFEIALNSPDIKAGVPYYGTIRQEMAEPLGRTQVAFLVIYGALDNRVTAQRPMVEERLRAAGKPFEVKVYEGAGHAFFNDTRPNTGNFGYHQASAEDAWKSTLAWFRRHLPSA